MMKIRLLNYGLYSLKNCHKQFGKGFQHPPPFWSMPKYTQFFLARGYPLVILYDVEIDVKRRRHFCTMSQLTTQPVSYLNMEHFNLSPLC